MKIRILENLHLPLLFHEFPNTWKTLLPLLGSVVVLMYVILKILYDEMSKHLEVNQCFPDDQCMDKRCIWSTRAIQQIVTEHEKLTDMALDSTL